MWLYKTQPNAPCKQYILLKFIFSKQEKKNLNKKYCLFLQILCSFRSSFFLFFIYKLQAQFEFWNGISSSNIVFFLNGKSVVYFCIHYKFGVWNEKQKQKINWFRRKPAHSFLCSIKNAITMSQYTVFEYLKKKEDKYQYMNRLVCACSVLSGGFMIVYVYPPNSSKCKKFCLQFLLSKKKKRKIFSGFCAESYYRVFHIHSKCGWFALHTLMILGERYTLFHWVSWVKHHRK